MPIEIKVKTDPPPALIRVIEEEYLPIETIKNVLIDAKIPELKADGNIGAFLPIEGIVLIDLNNCLKSNKWVNMGMMIIPSVWFNMLDAVYHEAAHAKQLIAEPELIKLDILPEIKEHAARLEAHDKIFEWAEKNKVPKINEMGWAGQEVKKLINSFFFDPIMRVRMLEEMDINNSNGVAEVEDFIACRGEDFNKNSHTDLCEAIDKGDFGLKIKGKRYLHADEFFAAD